MLKYSLSLIKKLCQVDGESHTTFPSENESRGRAMKFECTRHKVHVTGGFMQMNAREQDSIILWIGGKQQRKLFMYVV